MTHDARGTHYIADFDRLISVYGQPAVRCYDYDLSQETWNYWRQVTVKRSAEVVMLLRRSNGRYLVHTKDFYPQGIYRLMSGGLKPNELLLDAAYREAHEETGLTVELERFIGILEHRFHYGEEALPFISYLVSLDELGGVLGNQDPGEAISGYREVSLAELSRLADQLESLPDDWIEWGRFRASAHRLAVEILSEEQE